MISDADAEEKLVDRMIRLMANEEEKRQLSEHIKQLGIGDASERIASEIQKILDER